jgi:hypothetical protein
MDYDIELRPADAGLEAGFPFRNFKGKVTLSGRVSPEGAHTLRHGLVQAQDFTINGLPVTWLSSPLVLTEDSVSLGPITGRMANGTVSGTFKAALGKGGEYSGAFELKDASVRQAAEELFGRKMGKTTGRANGWIRFQGKGSDRAFLKGKGEIALSQSNLWEVPFFSSLIKTLSMGAVPGVDFTDSFAHFHINADRLEFTKAYFHSPVMNLDCASGMLFLDGRLDFIFKISLFSSIMKWDPTGLTHEILKRVEGEFNAVRVTGTAKKVELEMAPLGVLKLKRALQGGEGEPPEGKTHSP